MGQGQGLSASDSDVLFEESESQEQQYQKVISAQEMAKYVRTRCYVLYLSNYNLIYIMI